MSAFTPRKIIWILPFALLFTWRYLIYATWSNYLLTTGNQDILTLYPHFGSGLLVVRKLVIPLLKLSFCLSIFYIIYVYKAGMQRFVVDKWKHGALAIASVLITFTICELGLRLLGYRPGLIHGRADFSYDDSLQLSNTYIADSLGIMRFSPYAVNAVDSTIKTARKNKTNPAHFNDRSLESLTDDFLLPENESHFTAFISSLTANNEDSYASLLKTYANNPLNNDGFRSIPFNAQSKGKKKVFLIGDSFAYGFSARPITESFYDKILIDGTYLVYNGGITATDPVQYLQIAHRYIPEIKPDYVLVSFFMGNDVLYYPRPSAPFQFAQYPVDNLFITANPYGEYLSVAEANKVVRLNNVIPNQSQSVFNRVCAKTVISTRLWVALSKVGLVNGKSLELEKYERAAVINNPIEITRAVLKEIDATATANQTKLIFIIIPDATHTNPYNSYNSKALFKGFDAIFLPDSLNWYRPFPDGHLNNYGSAMAANAILKKLNKDSVLSNKQPVR